MPGEGGRGTLHNGLCGEAPPERGAFFTRQVYKRVRKSVIWVLKRAFNYNISNRRCITLFVKFYMKIRTRLPKVGIFKGNLFCQG